MTDEAGRMRRTKATILFGPYGHGGAVEAAQRGDVSLLARLRDERAQVRELEHETRELLQDRAGAEHYAHQSRAYDELIGELAIDEPREVTRRYA